MNRWLIVLMILVTVTACSPAALPVKAPSATAGATTVRFDLPVMLVAVGSVFTVRVQLDDVTGLVGDQVAIAYNPSVLQVQDSDPNNAGVQVALGSFLKPDFVAQNSVDADRGQVKFSALQLPPSQPVSGSGVLATITFQAKTSGPSPLTFETVALSDREGTPIKFVLQNGQVVVNSK